MNAAMPVQRKKEEVLFRDDKDARDDFSAQFFPIGVGYFMDQQWVLCRPAFKDTGRHRA